MTRLTSGGGHGSPVWSPDGRYVAFMSWEGISWNRADGAQGAQLLVQSNSMRMPWSFAPDGKQLSFEELEISNSRLIGGMPQALAKSPFAEQNPGFSPDGRWIASSTTVL